MTARYFAKDPANYESGLYGFQADPLEDYPNWSGFDVNTAQSEAWNEGLPVAGYNPSPTPTRPARAPRDYTVVTIAGSGDVDASTESERIAIGATFVNDTLTRELRAVSELRDGHRVRFLDPHGELGGLLDPQALAITTNDAAMFRYGGVTGASFTTAREGAVVDVELVKGAQGDGSDSVWIVGGDGGGLIGL